MQGDAKVPLYRHGDTSLPEWQATIGHPDASRIIAPPDLKQARFVRSAAINRRSLVVFANSRCIGSSPENHGSSVSGCTPTRNASSEVVHFGRREATEAHSCGRQPAVSREERRLSREAVTAVHRTGVLSPLRGSRCPDLDFLGLTPKATCCRHFVAESVQLQKARARTLQSVTSSSSLALRVSITKLLA